MTFRKNQGNSARILILAAIIISCILINVALIIQARSYSEDVTIEERYELHSMGGDEKDEFSISFDLTEGNRADVYILSEPEYEKYSNNGSFTPSFVEEKTPAFDEMWIRPDGQTYYIVIDNQNNSRQDDAQPDGNISYRLTVVNETEVEEFFDRFDDIMGIYVAGVIACCAIIIIVIILVIYLIFKKDKPSNVVMGGGYPPPQQYPTYPQGAPPVYQPPPPQAYVRDTSGQPPQEPPMARPFPPPIPEEPPQQYQQPMPEQPPQQYQQSMPPPRPDHQEDQYPPPPEDTPRQGQRRPPEGPYY